MFPCDPAVMPQCNISHNVEAYVQSLGRREQKDYKVLRGFWTHRDILRPARMFCKLSAKTRKTDWIRNKGRGKMNSEFIFKRAKRNRSILCLWGWFTNIYSCLRFTVSVTQIDSSVRNLANRQFLWGINFCTKAMHQMILIQTSPNPPHQQNEFFQLACYLFLTYMSCIFYLLINVLCDLFPDDNSFTILILCRVASL